jgi:hypothetical protein
MIEQMQAGTRPKKRRGTQLAVTEVPAYPEHEKVSGHAKGVTTTTYHLMFIEKCQFSVTRLKVRMFLISYDKDSQK